MLGPKVRVQIVFLPRLVAHELGHAEGLGGEHGRAEEGPGAGEDAGYEGFGGLEGRGVRGAAGDEGVGAVGAGDEGGVEVGGAAGRERLVCGRVCGSGERDMVKGSEDMDIATGMDRRRGCVPNRNQLPRLSRRREVIDINHQRIQRDYLARVLMSRTRSEYLF